MIDPPLTEDEGLARRLFEKHDWPSSLLGPREGWPGQLKMLTGFLLESSQPMFLLWGPERVFLFNDAFQPILGDEHQTALAKPVQELWAEIWPDIAGYIDDAYAGRSKLIEDVPLRTWSSNYQETRYYTFSYSPIRDMSREVVAAICAANDTTGKVLSQRQLQEERDRLHMLFEQAPVFLAVGTAPEMRFEYANKAYRDLVGVDDLAGRTVSDALPAADAQGFSVLLQHVAETGEPFFGSAMPFERMTDQGCERHVLDFVYQPIFTGDKVTGILCVGSDVTAQHEAREKARKLQDQIQHGARLNAMGAMAATLAHELNQPLTAAANYLQGSMRLASRSSKPDADLAVALAETEKQIMRAAEIIRRVRALVSGSARHETVPVGDLVNSAISQSNVAVLCPGLKTSLKLERGEELVFVDPIQIEQVLINLIRNAGAAMHSVERPRLGISSRKVESWVQIKVRDNGPGLSSELMEVLFSPFVESEGGGMGIGLSICRTIIEAQGGRIAASNNDEGGATFELTVPAATGE